MSVDQPLNRATGRAGVGREPLHAPTAPQIIIVDGSRIDAERMRMELRRAGVSNRCRIVANIAALRPLLQSFPPDAIISELHLADAVGLAVERSLRELAPDVPLIFVSDSVYDEVVAASIGAGDYVPKLALFRLPAVVATALWEARERRRMRSSLRDVGGRSREHVERLEAIWRVVNDPEQRGKEVVALSLSALRKDFRLYFNLSGRQAGDPKVVRAFTDAARSGLALEKIGVEITESDAMRDVDATRHVCRALRRLNVRIAIDDFGTGYSSLSSLKRLPIDLLKIDRAFVSGILDDPHDETIAETIISIANHFKFDTLAEGAERPEELAWLRARGCRFVQGYVVCHPLPFEAFKTWLAHLER